MTFPSYPAYKDSGIEWLGQIPAHWNAKRLGQFFEERREKVSDTDYPALSVTMQGIVPQLETAAKTDAGDNRKLVLKNDFVINSRSDRKGSSGVSPYDGSVSLISIVMEPKRIEPAYAHHLLRSYPFQEEFYRFGKGIVADLWSTNSSEMKNILIPEIPQYEQEAIANFLDHETAKIDTLIEKQQQLIELLKEKRQAVISQAVTKGLNPDAPMRDSGVAWIGQIPEHWNIAEVRRFTLDHRQGFYSEKGYDDSGHRVVRITDILEGNVIDVANSPYYIMDEENKARYELKKGDFLFQRTGAHKKIGVFDSNEPSVYASYLIRFRFDKRLNHGFLLDYFNSKSYKDQLDEQIHGGVNPNIHAENIKVCKLAVPPISEQELITQFIQNDLRTFQTLISKSESAMELLKERRTALISSAVTGKIDVRNIDGQ